MTEQPDPFGDVRKGAPLDRCARGVGSKLDPIAMQLVEDTDADAALQAGTMTPQRAVHIITHVAKALDTSPTLTTLCIVRFTSRCKSTAGFRPRTRFCADEQQERGHPLQRDLATANPLATRPSRSAHHPTTAPNC